MGERTQGIHHITAIVGEAQENTDFYAGVLGMRLVKKTVNFDDPGTYHLYFGNEEGAPGTIMTFFPWGKAYQGKVGDGQVGVTAFAVPEGAFAFWRKRLEAHNVSVEEQTRFGESYLRFQDPHGLQLELVERASGEASGWTGDGITRDTAIKGFAGAVLFTANAAKTAELLEEVIGFARTEEDGDYVRFVADGTLGNILDIKQTRVGTGQMGVGTVHHIAFRADDDVDQLEWKNRIEAYGLGVTPVQDRNYFRSIYFREYGDLLFEIATDPPGFTIDESPDALGEQLKLPKQYEQYRKRLLAELPPVYARPLE
ncbi:ring-cleaving dioxygenase [Planococcus plakortidis]|uniref:Ring-cleaving dioxygenase n=1 Tax=Planococcus plakortidis TaxID=1038856 RepID=A0A1C7EBM7_9BACL|nr:ring-cleaving dioxygenase [Planococcus plakortidis]ANU21106.1 ring-cleaving dioxygenase [Planococcus plakortidis]